MNKNDLIEVAKELDHRLPNFFGIVYEKHKDEIKKWIDKQWEISTNSSLVYQYIREHMISILNKDFNDFLKTAPLELLYWMNFILNRIDINFIQCDNNEENYAYYSDFNNQSFVNIVMRFKEFDLPSGVDIYKYPVPNTTPYDSFEYNGEEIDFSHSESVWCNKVNDKIIKEFFFDEITLQNIKHDISAKTEGLYKALLNKDLNPYFSETWTEDYVELIGYVLDGKYKVNDEIISLDKIECSVDDCDYPDDKEIIFGHAISNESIFIHFNNWRHKKNDKAFKAFLKVIYKMISFFTDINEEIDFALLTNKEIVSRIVSLTKNKIEDCKGSPFKLDYLPKFKITVVSHYKKYGRRNYWETNRLVCDYLKNTNEAQLLEWFVNRDMYWDKYLLAYRVIACGQDRADMEHFMNEFDANQRKIDFLKKEANKIHELGFILQSLFFLYDAIIVGEDDIYELEGDKVSELISTLEDRILQDRKVSVDIEKKLRRVSSYALDNNNSRVLNEYKNEILLILSVMFNEISYDEAGLLKISKIKNSVITKLNDSGLAKSDEEIISTLIESIENFLIKLADFLEKDDRRKLIGVINKLQMDFVDKYDLGISADELINYFPNRDIIENFLVTSELVFNTLSNREDKNELDFSPAIISLTKAMELIMNWAFVQMRFERSDIDKASARYYFSDSGDKKKSITLGSCINLLKDSSIIIFKDTRLEWGTKYKSDRGTIESRFEKINKNSSGKNVYHFNRLNKFRGLKIKINYNKGNDTHETEVCFNEDSEQNRLIFIKGLEYIKDNYRNRVAHKDGIQIDAAEECRKLMIQTQNLLWILMYLLIEE